MNNSALELRETPFASADYEATLALRNRVLRAPLGLSVWDEDLASEVHQRHFSLWQPPQQLLACLVIAPLDAGKQGRVKLRQMTVDPACHRQGLGQQLIARVESRLRADGVRRVELHARVQAIAFYQVCGYQLSGDAFIELGIEHRRMVKHL